MRKSQNSKSKNIQKIEKKRENKNIMKKSGGLYLGLDRVNFLNFKIRGYWYFDQMALSSFFHCKPSLMINIFRRYLKGGIQLGSSLISLKASTYSLSTPTPL